MRWESCRHPKKGITLPRFAVKCMKLKPSRRSTLLLICNKHINLSLIVIENKQKKITLKFWEKLALRLWPTMIRQLIRNQVNAWRLSPIKTKMILRRTTCSGNYFDGERKASLFMRPFLVLWCIE